MFNFGPREFLFRCEDCQTVLATTFEEKEDLKKLDEDRIVFDCECGGTCLRLRD